MDISETIVDLVDEQNSLDAVMASLPDEAWRLETPSPRWNVADQISHITYFDRAAALAITDPKSFKISVNDLIASAVGGPEESDEFTLGKYRKLEPSKLLEAWRDGRSKLTEASLSLTNQSRVIWYGPSMGSNSFLTARLMEVWAHGQDILDTTGLKKPESSRLRHIAHLGLITRGWTYINRGLNIPEGEVRVELTSPSNELWTWGPDGAPDHVKGTAKDFCLVVTQRRHASDTDLEIVGDLAKEWMELAQAFAGPATQGPTKGKKI